MNAPIDSKLATIYHCFLPDGAGWLCAMRPEVDGIAMIWIPPAPEWREINEDQLGECLPPEQLFTPEGLAKYRDFMKRSLEDFAERTGIRHILVEDVPWLGLRMFHDGDGRHRLEMHPAHLGAAYDWGQTAYFDIEHRPPVGLPARQAQELLRERAFAVMTAAFERIERSMAADRNARRRRRKGGMRTGSI